VSLDCVIYCAFYSILYRGAVFSRCTHLSGYNFNKRTYLLIYLLTKRNSKAEYTGLIRHKRTSVSKTWPPSDILLPLSSSSSFTWSNSSPSCTEITRTTEKTVIRLHNLHHVWVKPPDIVVTSLINPYERSCTSASKQVGTLYSDQTELKWHINMQCIFPYLCVLLAYWWWHKTDTILIFKLGC